MAEVKKKRRAGQSRISSKNQVTIPVDALRAAGLEQGDAVRIEAKGPGRIAVYRLNDVIAKYAGDLTGVYEPGYLEQLRNEWR